MDEHTSKKIIKKMFLGTEHMEGVINHYTDLVKIIPDIVHELTIIFDRVLWYSMYWNNYKRLWQISKHTDIGWTKPDVYSPKELEGIIREYSDHASEIFSIQYRSSSGIILFFNDKKEHITNNKH